MGRIEALSLVFIGLFALAVAIAALVGLVLLVRRLAAGKAPAPVAEPAARQLLEARYARGELDRDTFLRMREDLSVPEGPPSST
ncbi:MAG: SHOCT domain-containing protein [Anaerolineae bacterium]